MEKWVYLYFSSREKVIGIVVESSELPRNAHELRTVHPRVHGHNAVRGDYCLTLQARYVDDVLKTTTSRITLNDLEMLLKGSTPQILQQEGAILQLTHAMMSIAIYAASHGEKTEFMS